jgi:hypothetical protein
VTVALPAGAPAAELEAIATVAPAHLVSLLGLLAEAPPSPWPLGPWLRYPAALLIVARPPVSALPAEGAPEGALCVLERLEGDAAGLYARLRALNHRCAAVVWTPPAWRDLGPCPG